METNLSIGKHTKRVFACLFERLLTKISLDVSFMCLSRFVAFRVTFNDLCCGLLYCIHLWLTEQKWLTGPNDSVSHFKAVFLVC